MSVLPAPAVALVVVLAGIRPLLTGAFLSRVVLLGVLGLSFNFVLPIRAAQDPIINEGEPRCESVTGAALAIYTHGRTGCTLLADNLTRRQYQPPPVTERKAPFGAQLEMWWQYFEWQWGRGLTASELPWGARLPLAGLFLGLGFLGLAAVWRSDRILFAYLATLTGTLTLALVYYLNFRYGYSLAPEIADLSRHEVRERDYFYIAGFMLWGVLAGLGLARGWHMVSERAGGRLRPGAPILVLALVPLMLNWSWASRSGDYAARDWAYDLLMSVEPYGILFTNGDNDTFPLWYLQEVEGIRQDVTVIVGQYLYTTWYPKQLQRHTAPERQRSFDPSVESGLYTDRPAPERSILRLEEDQIDRVGWVTLSEDFTVPFPTLAVTYPAGMTLDRSHQIALSIIHDSVQERPIYFSAVGGLLTDLGLERWAIRQGLVSKLEFRRIEDPAPEWLVQGRPEYGAEWFDLERSIRLYRDVYLFRGVRDREIWPDRATLNIPWQYYALSLQLSDVAEASGLGEALVTELLEDAAAFQVVAEGGVRGAVRRAPMNQGAP